MVSFSLSNLLADATIEPEGPTFPSIIVTASVPLHELRIRIDFSYDLHGRQDRQPWNDHHIMHGGREVRYPTAPLARGGVASIDVDPWVEGDATYGGWRHVGTARVTGTNPTADQLLQATDPFVWAAVQAWSDSRQFDETGFPLAKDVEPRWGLLGVRSAGVGPIWNWRTNVSEGAAGLAAALAEARARPAREREQGRYLPDFQPREALLEAWERYGTGAPYWQAGRQGWERALGGAFADACLEAFARHPNAAVFEASLNG